MEHTTMVPVDFSSSKVYHSSEEARIQVELDSLGNKFSEDGIVRTILSQRMKQEKDRSENGCDDEMCSCI